MRHVFRTSILIFAVLAICLANIFPVEDSLRLGKDLAGGVSLVYTVDVQPDDPPEVVDRTIEVLKDRVNPQGLYEITFVQQGRDRIEVTMPLPNERVKRLRAELDIEINKIEDYSIDIDAFERAMRLRGQERREALDQLMSTPARAGLLEPVQEAVDRADETREAYELARTSTLTDPAALTELLDAAGQAEEDLERARRAVIGSIVTPEQMRTALELAKSGHTVRDSQTGQTFSLPSPREQALTSISDRIGELPGAKALIDDIVARHEVYSSQRKGLDDPSDLIRLLKGAGVLNFRIGVTPGELPDEDRLRRELRERGPDGVRSTNARWFPVNKLEGWYSDTASFQEMIGNPAGYFASRYRLVAESRNGIFYVLLKDEPGARLTQAEGDWALDAAFRSSDEIGRPAIGFRMNGRGASLLGELTDTHRQKQMAVVLDDQLYSSATIQGRIAAQGQISGNFDDRDLNYIIKTLNAGSLTAKLGAAPISQSTLAPDLGLDNLRKGLDAAWIALIAVSSFMIFYYFSSGAIAVFALLCNAIIILGIMGLQKAAFTLPGIAGVILTFGTAVDANVLIYERIREEILAGNDPRTAVRVAFKRVSATIIDANMTNLIICLVLAIYGTQEIKGFGITLGIGVVGNMFCALVITRLLFTVFVDHLRFGKGFLSQLPIVFPVIDRVLTPRINWMGMYPFFIVASISIVLLGFSAVWIQGEKMLGTEFRGGIAVTLQFKKQSESADATAMTMVRKDVQDRVREIAEAAIAEGKQGLAPLLNAEVVPVNPEADGITSERFTIRTVVASEFEQDLMAAIVSRFQDIVDSRPALEFASSDAETIQVGAPIYQIIEPTLGANIGRPEVLNDVSQYLGGVAIVMSDFDPPPTRANLLQRLEYMRSDPTFSSRALRRVHEIVVLDGTNDAVKTAVLLVYDSTVNVFEDEAQWRAQFAQNEWELVRAALTVPTVLASVNSFSPAVAATFRATAIVSIVLSFMLILIYVWVRFGSVRYSLAAILPLVHDVLAAIGLIAFAEILYEHFPGAAAIGIRPFKIDMGMVAAIMAIIGYSLNDTIVILDRVRENRGKLVHASKEVINRSINQTLSRTLITTGTTIAALLVLFLLGGEGVASFSYALLCGMIVGTYSSIGVAAPIVYDRHARSPGQIREEFIEEDENPDDDGRSLPPSRMEA